MNKTPIPTLEQMTSFLRDWAQDNQCVYVPNGKIGFGRPCVGILKHDHYARYDEESAAAPPDEVENAYHKGPYLAVLGTDEDAVYELYVWVKNLEEKGYVVATQDYQPDNESVQGRLIEHLFHGFVEPVLVASK